MMDKNPVNKLIWKYPTYNRSDEVLPLLGGIKLCLSHAWQCVVDLPVILHCLGWCHIQSGPLLVTPVQRYQPHVARPLRPSSGAPSTAPGPHSVPNVSAAVSERRPVSGTHSEMVQQGIPELLCHSQLGF